MIISTDGAQRPADAGSAADNGLLIVCAHRRELATVPALTPQPTNSQPDNTQWRQLDSLGRC